MDRVRPLSIEENVPLAPLTTLGVGGPARFFVSARTEEEVREALRHASSRGLDLFILGGGSNILVSDAGFDGMVVRLALEGAYNDSSAADQDRSPSAEGGRMIISVGAGEDWDGFVEHCVGRDLAGIECLSGIPGSVGGTPVQNVGAYGQEVSETIVTVRCLDRKTGDIVDLSNRDCRFSYRRSIFNSTVKDRYVVLSVTFALRPGGKPKIEYRDLKEYFAGPLPSLNETRRAILNIRGAKSMVIDPNDPNSKSAGSFFKNPIVPRKKLTEITTRTRLDPIPYFEAGNDLVKIPAAWLIESAGFHKGFAMGSAGISTNHSLALINRGGATARDILDLKDRITMAVEDIFEIQLVPEPVFVGF